VERARAGDRAAFDGLYACCVGRVYAVCLRLSGDRGEAERLTQDTFVRAWRGLAGFRGDSRFTSWLHRLAVNEVLQDRRATGRREQRIRPTADEVLQRAPGRDGSPALRIDLERAIAVPAGRQAEQQPRSRATRRRNARLLGIATGTAAQLHRARRLLRSGWGICHEPAARTGQRATGGKCRAAGGTDE
jgi:RNA polymerase sigma-70 factor (ECF subfamily)